MGDLLSLMTVAFLILWPEAICLASTSTEVVLQR
jgi:hypothetical protein